MKLPFRRSKSKKAKASDALASVAKLWAELQLAKRASKGVEKGAEQVRSSPAKVIGGLALLGGAGALIARKLKGGPEPLPYVPAPPPPGPPPAAVNPVPWKAATIDEPAPTPDIDATASAPAGESASELPDGDELASEGPGGGESASVAPGGEEMAADDSEGEGPGTEGTDADEPDGDEHPPGAAG